MEISATLPDEVARRIREGLLTGPQVQQMLGLGSRYELDGFLKRAGVYLDYTEEDLEADIRTLDELMGT